MHTGYSNGNGAHGNHHAATATIMHDGNGVRVMARAQAKRAFFDSKKQEAATTQDQLRASVACLDVATQAKWGGK